MYSYSGWAQDRASAQYQIEAMQQSMTMTAMLAVVGAVPTPLMLYCPDYNILYYTIPYYTIPYYTILCYATLRYATLRYATLR